MATRKSMARTRKDLEDKIEEGGKYWIDRQPADMGNYAGVVKVPNTENMVYVRLANGNVVQAFNNTAPAIYNWKVFVGRDKSQPSLFKVIEVRWVYNVANTVAYVLFHHKQHEYPAPDTIWIRRDQFMPLLVLPGSGLTIQIYGDIIYRRGMTSPIKVTDQTVDVTPYIPATGAQYYIVEVTTSGNINLVAGATAATVPELTLGSPLPVPTTGSFPICALILYAGQTSLRRDSEQRDIIDLRMFTSEVTPATGDQISLATADTPLDSDLFGFWDVVDDALKNITWANVKATLKTYFDTLYATIAHTHAYLPDDATYTDISTNDPDTDVTGAELEELTDGSTTALHSHAGGSASWGGISGTLSDQTDLQSALDDKLDVSSFNAHLSDTTDAHDASAISNVPAGSILSTNVQDAITELDTNIQNHITAVSDAHDATAISTTPAGSMTSTDVQGAIDELDTRSHASDIVGAYPDILVTKSSTTFALQGVIDASITADVDDWNPTGLASASVIRISNDGEWTITGIAIGAGDTDGKILTLVNLGESRLILSNGNPLSSVDNRFDFADDVFLGALESLILWYDTTSNRWRMIGETHSLITATEVANSPAGGISSTNVQAAINELDTEKSATSHNHAGTYALITEPTATTHIGNSTGAHAGTAVSNTPAGNIAATTVQAAINELDNEKQTKNQALTDISGLSPSNDDIIQRKAGAWANRTLAQLITDLRAAFGFRELLTAARTYYVRTDGSDSNNGLTNTSGGAFLTIQKAVDVISSTLDIAGNTVTIQVGDGTYTGTVTLKNVVGYATPGNLVIQGNNGTPANVHINVTGNCFTALSISSIWDIKDMKLTSTNISLRATNAYLRFSNIVFGGTVIQVYASFGGTIECTGNYSIVANATYHLTSSQKGSVSVQGFTVTLTGTPAFTTFALCEHQSYLAVNASTFSGAASAGTKKYDSVQNSEILLGGVTLPGGVAGTTGSGGIAV